MIKNKKTKTTRPSNQTPAVPAAKPVMGRPSKYRPEFCDMLIAHMEKGFSFETFAAVIDVHPDTVFAWSSETNPQFHEDFSYAKKIAFARNRLYWETKGHEGMTGKIRNFNSTVWVFNMKNRFKWHDNLVVNQTVKDESAEKVSAMAEKLTAAIKTSLEGQ